MPINLVFFFEIFLINFSNHKVNSLHLFINYFILSMLCKLLIPFVFINFFKKIRLLKDHSYKPLNLKNLKQKYLNCSMIKISLINISLSANWTYLLLNIFLIFLVTSLMEKMTTA